MTLRPDVPFLASVLTAVLLGAGAVRGEVNEQGYDIVAVVTHESAEGDAERGGELYDTLCSQCHGVNGDGRGTMTRFLRPAPRDLTSGVYKLRHTISGELPTDLDLFETIRDGMPGSSMPGWGGVLTDGEIWQLVTRVKAFAPDFRDFPAEEQVVIGEPIAGDEESVRRGAEVYREMQCAKCHGETGRGNGPSANELHDDWNAKMWPADLTKAWTFRGGPGPEQVYRTLVTGMSGTPMPSYAHTVRSGDAWHLSNFVASLSHAPVREVVVRAARVAVVPDDSRDDAWQRAPAVDFRMAGQIIREPRLFTPTNDEITVRALFDERDVAILLVWNDRTANDGADGAPPDRVGLQFPAAPGSRDEKPYFLMGDRSHPVDCWRWSADRGTVTDLLAHGAGDAVSRDTAVRAEGGFEDGQYRVILRRALVTGGDLEVRFEPGRFLPIAFNLWDGANGEEGDRKSISAWYYLLLEPRTPRSAFVWPVFAVLLATGAEIWTLRRVNHGV